MAYIGFCARAARTPTGGYVSICLGRNRATWPFLSLDTTVMSMRRLGFWSAQRSRNSSLAQFRFERMRRKGVTKLTTLSGPPCKASFLTTLLCGWAFPVATTCLVSRHGEYSQWYFLIADGRNCFWLTRYQVLVVDSTNYHTHVHARVIINAGRGHENDVGIPAGQETAERKLKK